MMMLAMTGGPPAPSPPLNASKCYAESCMTMPTHCGARPECVGCGELCFPLHAPTTAEFSTLINTTGLSEQSDGAAFDGSFPPYPGRTRAQCQSARPICVRGGGAMTLRAYKPTDPESASNAACCAACVPMHNALAWQMITKKGKQSPACWCMGTSATKPASDDKCVSAPTGAPPPPPKQSPLLRSSDFVITWDKLEPTEGSIDWSTLEASIANARGVGGALTMLFWVGAFQVPSWVYSANTTRGHERAAVDVLASVDGKAVCPNYLNPTFRALQRSRHVALAAKLRELEALGNVVVGFQPCIGSTGDDTPIHVDAKTMKVNKTALALIVGNTYFPPTGRSGTDWWSNYTREFSSNLATEPDLFGKEIINGKFALLLNAQGVSWGLEPVSQNFPGSLLKFGQAGHEYQSDWERYRAAQHAPYTYSLQTPLSGAAAAAAAASTSTDAAVVLRPIRSRAELSSETCWTSNGPFFTPSKCPVKGNFLAMARWVAAVHLDYWNVQPGSVASVDSSFDPLWRFLNRYSGLRFPQQREARGVWIAFRDGLDAADIDRFSEATFGPYAGNASHAPGNPGNVARAVAVCAAHAAQGCAIDSKSTLGGGPMGQRRQIGMNDVAFGSWRGDYANFIARTDAMANLNVSTRGWWRVGAGFMANTTFFGRYARGWREPTDATATLGLTIDRGMWGGLPLVGSEDDESVRTLTLRLVFFDRGTGQFTIHYDGSGSGAFENVVVKKQGSGEWMEICFAMKAPAFAGTGPQGASVWLTNDDKEDDIFDSLEISEDTAEEIAMAGCNWKQ